MNALKDTDPTKTDPPRERFAPMLAGDPSCVEVVRSRREALHLQSMQRRENVRLSTVIVSRGNSRSLNMPQDRAAIEGAKYFERHDQEQVQAGEEMLLVSRNRTKAEEQRLAKEQARRLVDRGTPR